MTNDEMADAMESFSIAVWPCGNEWQAEVAEKGNVWDAGGGEHVANGQTPAEAVAKCKRLILKAR